jgi:hypothetical protein
LITQTETCLGLAPSNARQTIGCNLKNRSTQKFHHQDSIDRWGENSAEFLEDNEHIMPVPDNREGKSLKVASVHGLAHDHFPVDWRFTDSSSFAHTFTLGGQ